MYTSGESETLILKRLESALNNGSSEQLKIAAYKLHEKFHSGHRFEYKNELKQGKTVLTSAALTYVASVATAVARSILSKA